MPNETKCESRSTTSPVTELKPERESIVKFRLDINKAIAATAYLIQKAGGRYDVFVLIQTLYYADRKGLVKYGRTITGDKLVSMDKGPVVSNIYDLIKGKQIHRHPRALALWRKFISERESHLL